MNDTYNIIWFAAPKRDTGVWAVYDLFNDFLLNLNLQNWIQLYIHWEISLIKELGFEVDLNKSSNFIMMNNRSFKIPKRIK